MAGKTSRTGVILNKTDIDERKSRAISYVRLSKAEKDDSLTHQKAIIREYVSHQNDIQIVLEIEDRNRSGTNFYREGFITLLEAIKKSKADCVIVKDLSRFGRNMQEVSEYLELIFPRLGVRFISVLDGYDSQKDKNSEEMFLLQIKNLLHESYSRDISRKIHASIAVMQQEGKWIGGIPYGYQRKEKDLIIDTDAAEVVKQIYYLAAIGKTDRAIADILNQNRYTTPREYQKTKQIYSDENRQWSVKSIKNILRKV
ncbi:MAG: recombinase family protein [Lachnospiraceae bacterium]|nr:recombinase family protein [Lachnospiraceae bacterium]